MGEHWQESPSAWRRTPRPRGWKALREQALARDGHRCTWVEDGEQCPAPGTDVDHIGDPADHTLDNLRVLCGPHHRRRTALQARAARGEMPTRRRPTEAHPGLIEQPKSDPLAEARRRAREEMERPPF